MFTTAARAFSTAARNCSRYFGSVEGKCPVQGSILLIWNFSMTWAAKSFRSMGFAALLSSPAINSRKEYEAIAIRSRGGEGNFRLGAELAWAEAGSSHTATAVAAHCCRKRLREVVKHNSVTER